MSRPFKFRYANEIAGTFVILTLALFIAGVFMAGRSQGWFEGKFDLMIDFDTAEGSFGLQEGGEVWVMNTVAGRVSKIEPQEDGGIRGQLVLQNRYLPLIREDSVARVKRKFGLAGDAFVEIDVGSGAGIVDGATIPGVKDEEIMDTAKKMLKDLETDVLPMIEDSREILAHVNTISAAIADGGGLAGAAIHDPEMTTEVKAMLQGANALILDSSEAIQETTRLIQGAQKHWLIRKYITDPVPEMVLSVSQLDPARRDRYVREWTRGVEAGRIGNSPAHVAANALNMAYLALDDGALADCEVWLAEARFEMETAGLPMTRITLLAADLARRRGRPDHALAVLASGERPGWGDPRAERAAWGLLEARAYLDAGQMGEARAAYEDAEHQARRSDMEVLAGDAAILEGDIALADQRTMDAVAAFNRAADTFRDSALYGAMCRALVRAGAIYEGEGDTEQAFARYYRAARSRLVSGIAPGEALAAARRSGVLAANQALLTQLDILAAATE